MRKIKHTLINFHYLRKKNRLSPLLVLNKIEPTSFVYLFPSYNDLKPRNPVTASCVIHLTLQSASDTDKGIKYTRYRLSAGNYCPTADERGL